MPAWDEEVAGSAETRGKCTTPSGGRRVGRVREPKFCVRAGLGSATVPTRENHAMSAVSRRWLVLSAAFACAAPALAEVKPNPVFSDNMVLQRQMPVKVWGTADEGETVTVRINGQEAAAAAVAGKWQVELKPMEAGGPFTMEVAGKSTLQFKNVLVGEVWICSGQSNMAFGLINASTAKEAIASSANPNLRLLSIPRNPTDEPQATADCAWTPCNPDTVKSFTAVGYFFGRDL